MVRPADVLSVNKADGSHVTEAKAAARELATALELLHPPGASWIPPVLTCSALTGDGIAELWSQIEQHRVATEKSGDFVRRRLRQQIDWMWSTVEDRLIDDFRQRSDVRDEATRLEQMLADGTITPTAAARRLLGLS